MSMEFSLIIYPAVVLESVYFASAAGYSSVHYSGCPHREDGGVSIVFWRRCECTSLWYPITTWYRIYYSLSGGSKWWTKRIVVVRASEITNPDFYIQYYRTFLADNFDSSNSDPTKRVNGFDKPTTFTHGLTFLFSVALLLLVWHLRY